MTLARISALCLISVLPATAVLADAAPPPPPHNVWFGNGQLGFLESGGNSEAEAINAALNMSYIDDAWSHTFTLGGLYGKSAGTVSAENYGARWESDYKFTTDFFGFGALRYQHDDYGSSHYQETVTAGVGYAIINTTDVKLSGQLGVGYRRLDPTTLNTDTNVTPNLTYRTYGPVSGNAIATAGIDYSQVLTPTTTLTDVFLMESGSNDTMLSNKLAVIVKMSSKMSLSLGYAITDNTKAISPVKKIDTLATANLVYSF